MRDLDALQADVTGGWDGEDSEAHQRRLDQGVPYIDIAALTLLRVILNHRGGYVGRGVTRDTSIIVTKYQIADDIRSNNSFVS